MVSDPGDGQRADQTSAGQGPRSPVRRTLIVVLLFAVGVVLAGGMLLWRGRDDLLGDSISVGGLDVEPQSSEAESEPEGGLGKAKTVLVVGDDSGKVREDLRHLATGDRSGHRTDTIMLLRIDPERKRVTGINFPRDLRLTLCDGSVQKINAAMFQGGPGCLVRTVREFARVRIDHFVQVDFEGFVDIVKAVDGVTMYLEEPMSDPKAHLELKAGCVTLDGEQALGFVRTRSLDSDFGRIARQQRFLKELADEVTSLEVVANPVRLYQTVGAVGDMLKVDKNLKLGTMRDFAMTLRGIKSEDIVMQTIPTTTDPNGWYEDPIEDQTRPLLRAFKRGQLAEYLGEAPEEEPSESASGAPEPEPKIPLDELAPIAVLNASDVNRLAAETADVLTAAGVQVSVTGDTDRPEPDDVRIRYPARLKREARALRAGAFPDATLRRDRDASQVTVVLNGTFDPGLMEVSGAARRRPDPPVAQNEYTNAEPVKGHKDC